MVSPRPSATEAVPGLGEAVDELYRLPPAAFVARRDAIATSARAEGHKALAAAVKRLRRPTVSAWALNLLAREEPELVGQLVELGALLRDAQAGLDGQALRELDRQRRGLVGALARRAGALAGEQGQPLNAELSRQVEQSLGAALADPRAASAVTSGQLTTPLDNVGFGVEVAPDAVAVPDLVLVGSPRRRTSPDATTTPEPPPEEPDPVRDPASLDDARTRRERGRQERERARQEKERERARQEKERERARRQQEQQEREREARRAEARAELERARATEREAQAVDDRTAAAVADLRERLDGLRERLDDLGAQRDELAGRLADAEQEVQQETERLDEHEQQRSEAEQALAAARREVRRAERALED